ncbi:MAG: cation:proton antiporter [Bacilli bacterium]|nr:cation:proton antiporter [Bacilli bacterium]
MNMDIFLSLGLILIVGFAGGFLLDKIHMPKLIWYLVLGILFGPSLLNIISPDLLAISSYLRQIALVIILTRSGLSLDLQKLKEVGRPAILMCFVPACFEIAGIAIFAPLFFGISLPEALLLGSVLAAVSPAVVVPRMIKLQEEGLGDIHHVPELIMAGSSVDDIFVIVLFYSFKGIVANNSFDAWGIAQIPVSIISGIALGVAIGFLLVLFFRKIKLNNVLRVIVFFGASLSMLGLETLIKPYFSISSLLGVIVLGILVAKYCKEPAAEMKKSYNGMWNFFEILLFALVGCAVNAKYAFSSEGAIILGLVTIGLAFRSLGVTVSVCFTKFSWKERMFIVFSYLPKATVQASIGAIALSEGLACGELVLTAAVVAILFTAPIGAILMDTLKRPLLKEASSLVR